MCLVVLPWHDIKYNLIKAKHYRKSIAKSEQMLESSFLDFWFCLKESACLGSTFGSNNLNNEIKGINNIIKKLNVPWNDHKQKNRLMNLIIC